jgi:chromosome segregation ATPase
VTLSDESKEEALEFEKFLAFVAPLVEEEESYYSKHSDNGEELKEAYKTLYIEFEKLREGRKQHVQDLSKLQTEKSSLL